MNLRQPVSSGKALSWLAVISVLLILVVAVRYHFMHPETSPTPVSGTAPSAEQEKDMGANAGY